MKLLATDFDNTLFNKKDYHKNIKYINKFVDEGNLFVIVTGRYFDSLLKDIEGLNLKYSYLICNDGGIIFDRNLNILYRKDIPHNIANEIADIYNNSSCLSDWYIDTGTAITKDKTATVNGLIGRFNDVEKAKKLLSEIKEKYKEVDGYLSDKWINVTEKTVNKGSGIKELLYILKINESNVYTIGDDVNDISMSDYNFNSYSMSNSIIELKSKTMRSYNSVYELVMDILKDGLK
ncbi:MAG: HAD-IIB family hydrolase [Bacilli bacterium]|nr:HAD-IIB family hydrolase [Bacilli bacterium]MDD3304981.1 HAD-IIB family hydrolase [Bacilli bacterium]MDD4053861.1 HAD-IIB family hydrolase [Bacilli bacterium]MDD4411049.1 HAD-IIB family hydrolase [Bacilli bacterium]